MYMYIHIFYIKEILKNIFCTVKFGLGDTKQLIIKTLRSAFLFVYTRNKQKTYAYICMYVCTYITTLPFPPRPLTHFIVHSLSWPPSTFVPHLPSFPHSAPRLSSTFRLKPAIQPPTFHTSTTATAISKELVATTTASGARGLGALFSKGGI